MVKAAAVLLQAAADLVQVVEVAVGRAPAAGRAAVVVEEATTVTTMTTVTVAAAVVVVAMTTKMSGPTLTPSPSPSPSTSLEQQHQAETKEAAAATAAAAATTAEIGGGCGETHKRYTPSFNRSAPGAVNITPFVFHLFLAVSRPIRLDYFFLSLYISSDPGRARFFVNST